MNEGVTTETNERELKLSDVELRILGSLLEKEKTTPEYYPLTLNGLTNACNQKSNRDPVMNLENDEVRDAIETLRERRLTMMFHGADSRVPKFKHTLDSVFNLDGAETAILCVLFLRGPQTVGELRNRCQRLHPFPDLSGVETCLRALEEYMGQPLVAKLPRRPGQKEQRYAHTLGEQPVEDMAEGATTEPAPPPGGRVGQLAEEVTRQRAEIDGLKAELDALRDEFHEFKRQLTE